MLETERKIVSFTSERGGLGQTTTMANVAVSLARYGLNVALIDQKPDQTSKLKQLMLQFSLNNATLLGGIRIGEVSIHSPQQFDLPKPGYLPEADFVLSDSGPGAPSERFSHVVFFHRLDREGLEDATRALETIDKSRLILAPSLIPLVGDPAIYKATQQTIIDLRVKHSRIAPILLDYYLLIQEELYATTRSHKHPLVQNYHFLADLILQADFPQQATG